MTDGPGRVTLRTDQAALPAALLEAAAPPPGFDLERVDAQARALVARRTAYGPPAPPARRSWRTVRR